MNMEQKTPAMQPLLQPTPSAPSAPLQPVIIPLLVQVQSSHVSTSDDLKSEGQTSTGSIGIYRGFWPSYGGLVMALLSSVFFSVTMLIIKSMEPHGVKAFGGALLVNIGILIPSILVILFHEFGPGCTRRTRIFQSLCPNDSKTNWRPIIFLVVQGLLQGAAVILRTSALQFLSIGDMTVIVFSSPVVTTIIAHFVLKEKCGLVFIGIAVFTLVGVVLITKPPMLTGEKAFDSETLTGFGIAAGALLALSLTFVVTRKIKDEHVLTMTLSIGLVGFTLSLPLFLLFEDWNSIVPKHNETILLTLGFLMAFLAMSSIMMALKMENAGLVALVRSFDVIFAFLLQYIFLGVVPDYLSGIGASIVWLGVLFAGSHKYWSDKRSRKTIRRKRGGPEDENNRNGIE